MGYGSSWAGKEDQIKTIMQGVADKYPNDFAKAHARDSDGNPVPGSDTFIRRAAFEVNKVFPDAGLNGKRGDLNHISEDVLALSNPSGCTDASGIHLGLELRDVIISAGRPDARIGFTDVTQVTMDAGVGGAWIKPEPVPENGTGGTDPNHECELPGLPPRDEQLEAFLAFDESYKEAGRANRCLAKNEPLYIDNEGIAVWLGVYIGHRQAGMGHTDAIQQTREEMYDAGLPRPE